jgi:predicted ATP-dependent Lon-type protease
MAKGKNLGFRIPKINIIKEFAKRRITRPTMVMKKEKYHRAKEKEKLKREIREEGYG